MTETQTGAASPTSPATGPAGSTAPRPRDWRRALRRPDVLIPTLLIGVFLILWVLVLLRPDFLTSFDSWVRDRVQSVARSKPGRKPHWPLLKSFSDLAGGVAIHKVPERIQLPLAALAVVTLGAAIARRSWRPFLAAAFGVGALAFVLMLKANGHRPGPGMNGKLMHGGLGYFPSGHTSNTVLGYGTAAMILAWAFRSRGARRAIAGVMTLFALAMGFALVWLDDHWVSDVLAAYALCGAALFGVGWCLGFRLPGPVGAVRDRG